MIESGKDVVAKRRREETGRWKAGSGWRKESNLAQTHADPAARVDGIVVKSGRRGSHVEAPWIGTEAEGEVGEDGAAIKVGRESDEKNKAG